MSLEDRCSCGSSCAGRTLGDGGQPPKLSDDGRWWWNGQGWMPAYSLDGRSRFDGTRWVPARRVALPLLPPVAAAFWAAALLAPASTGVSQQTAMRVTHLRGRLVAISASASVSVVWRGWSAFSG